MKISRHSETTARKVLLRHGNRVVSRMVIGWSFKGEGGVATQTGVATQVWPHRPQLSL